MGQLDGGSVAVLPVIDSTNQYLLDRIGTKSCKLGDACVAEYQQAGRGRRAEMVFAFWRKLIFVDVLASEQGPAAAIGLVWLSVS
ncbi:hypothetical protein ACLK2G_20895 [Escherichia coli]